MSRKRFTVEEINGLLREVDMKLSQGRNVDQVSHDMGITERTYYRWRKEYGGVPSTVPLIFRCLGMAGQTFGAVISYHR